MGAFDMKIIMSRYPVIFHDEHNRIGSAIRRCRILIRKSYPVAVSRCVSTGHCRAVNRDLQIRKDECYDKLYSRAG